MCPFILFTFFFTVLMLMVEIAVALTSVAFNVSGGPIKLHEGNSSKVNFQISSSDKNELNGRYRLAINRPDLADINNASYYEFQISIKDTDISDQKYEYKSNFWIKAKFLGYCRIVVQKYKDNIFSTINEISVSIIRDKDLIAKIFIYSVAIVVSISFINMGCALDLEAVYQVLRYPTAPAIGIFSQYVFMPLLSFGLASMLFNETYLKLGIFIFGCSPGGGASNMWTILVKGNLDLSITMTFLSTLLSIGLMPFWLHTLGRTIYHDVKTSPPFRNIFTTLASMVIFLGIGLLIKRFLPRVAEVAKKILAPFSGIMIIFIIIFGSYANFYMFKVMTWQMLVAAAINVWCGMFFGFTLAYLFRKSTADMLTIAIETGVQNTGVAIVVLGLSLQQPDADLASAVPVAASIMTPIPLTIAWLVIQLRNHFYDKRKLSNILRIDSNPSLNSNTNQSQPDQYKYKIQEQNSSANNLCNNTSIC